MTAAHAMSRLSILLGVVGVMLLVLLFFPALFYFGGPFGDCFDTACAARDVILGDVAASQGKIGLFGFPVATIALVLLTRRTWHAWTVLAVVSLLVMVAGLVPVIAGFWETDPRILGVAVPLISPGFTFWIAPAMAFLFAGVLGTIAGQSRTI